MDTFKIKNLFNRVIHQHDMRGWDRKMGLLQDVKDKLNEIGPVGRRKVSGVTGLHEATLKRLMDGKTKNPHWGTLEAIEKALKQ